MYLYSLYLKAKYIFNVWRNKRVCVCSFACDSIRFWCRFGENDKKLLHTFHNLQQHLSFYLYMCSVCNACMCFVSLLRFYHLLGEYFALWDYCECFFMLAVNNSRDEVPDRNTFKYATNEPMNTTPYFNFLLLQLITFCHAFLLFAQHQFWSLL